MSRSIQNTIGTIVLGLITLGFCYGISNYGLLTQPLARPSTQPIDQTQVLKNQVETLNKKLEIQEEEIKKLKKIAAQKVAFQNELTCLAENIYYEAHTEPYDGQVAVAQVTVNRVHSGIYPHTVCGVVHQPAQFSWTAHARKYMSRSGFRDSLRIAKAVLTNKEKSDIIDSDVLKFHATYIAPPKWAANSEPVAIIGQHIFYK